MTASCTNCLKSAAELDIKLKQCGKCHVQPYCSRECQVAHWPIHKQLCSPDMDCASPKANADATANAKAPSPFNLEAFLNAIAGNSQSQSQSSPSNSSGRQSTSGQASQGEGGLFGKDLLDPTHPEATIYKHLIDCFRLRCEDQYDWAGEYYGIYNQESPFADFADFLNMAQDKGVLPGWWSKPKRKACLKLAGDKSGASCI